MLQQVIEIHELLDDATINGLDVVRFLESNGVEKISFQTITGEKGTTDFLKIVIAGSVGKIAGGSAPTLGVIGRLGGIGARPEKIGLVSDADGAIVALSTALKLSMMKTKGDVLKGDVIITTHVCPDAPIIPHEPVPFMNSPVDMATMNRHEIDAEMDAILSIDATKGNRVINHRGFAITPTIKEGYILPVSGDFLDIMEWTTGKHPKVVPISTQDITPYGNGLDHVNSILQPAAATNVPVVGVATTAETAVPECATGASRESDIEEAGRFCVEVAKGFTSGECQFYDKSSFERMLTLYGPMNTFQTKGGTP